MPRASPMSDLDRRLNVFRPDLADARLAGRYAAAAFVEGVPARVRVGATPLHPRPERTAPQDTELLFGETVRRFELRDGWAWVQNDRDGYVGYCAADALAPEGAPATHAVAVPLTHLYATPDIKRAPAMALSLESRVAVASVEGSWAALADGAGYIHADHLCALDRHADDPAAIAERLLDTPYLWGGKTSQGLDCSGLIQLALQRCGWETLRDSDMQADTAGRPIDPEGATPRRGDLIFWPGHVGIMVDESRILHANATDMATRVWPLDVLIAHIERLEGHAVGAVRRPGP